MTDPFGPADGRHRRHFVLGGFATTEPFRSPGRGGATVVPQRNRRTHGTALRRQLEAVAAQAETLGAEQGADEALGITVEFEGFPGVGLAFESLAREQSGIELLNVREDDGVTRATVFVPEGKLAHFERLITAYLAGKRSASGRALDHRRLVDTIASIRVGSLKALWTDAPELFPEAENQSFWWEVWLAVRGKRDQIVNGFRSRAQEIGMQVAPGDLVFPERTVLLVHGSPQQMKQSMALLNLIAELRKAKETAEFFDSLAATEQVEWVNDLLARSRFPEKGDGSPHVCLLDTGTNNGHRLLAPALGDADLHTVEPGWGVDDSAGHGTEMAGLALYGDLTPVLASRDLLRVEHRLESVKLLPRDGGNQGDARHHGYLTIEAVSRPEVTAPRRARVFGLALSSRDNRDRGRPSAWSAAVDRLTSDAEGEGGNPRLLVLCAGNADPNARADYPASNTTDSIHDPGQSWNALTVGSSTDLVRITETNADGYQPIAAVGGLSPFSTTSATWNSQWPLKPDLLFEGGNAGRDVHGAYTFPSLSLLTTHHRPAQRLLTTMSETSASTALGARMAAQLMSAYPGLRPESIRGLMVHSANWTDEMRRMYLPPNGAPNKDDYAGLIRHCGFGIPSLERAMWSASNSLSIIIEEQIQPFARLGSKTPRLRDMHLHSLPWPLNELESLGEATVQMRVTLSYFVEPNPSARGRSRYTYQSHGLRFDVKRADESVDGFRARVNRAAREEEQGTPPGGDDPDWFVGKTNRHRGSIHSDIWQGTAADLASRGVLAVYPALGWWKTRTAQQQYDRVAPYTLIVSIHAPTSDLDLYAAIENLITVRTVTEV